MSPNVCIVIPIYNHKDTIVPLVDTLSQYRLPIFVIDDGSDSATQRLLTALSAVTPLVRLHRLAQNSGKGAAVVHGLERARAAGFSHALQIDADGQHDAADVPRFLAAAQAHPEAVICGVARYDESVPKARLYGRSITHFWVWIETLSFDIADSMCGYRLYPLACTCQLIASTRLPQRMDFDTAIAVRLHWRGVAFINLPTKVVYPVGGLSHFHMLRDNLRVTRMHTVLVLGMLLRLPWLLWQKVAGRSDPEAHWSQLAERGGAWGLRLLYGIYSLLGARVTRWALVPVVAYFFLTGATARRASLDYLKRVRAFSGGDPSSVGWRDSFRHMMAFAQSGLDKLVAWMGDLPAEEVIFPNRSAFDALIASGRGALLIGAHLGNLEMTRALVARDPRIRVNAVVFTDHAQRFNRVLAKANASFGVNLIQVSHFGPDTAIVLRDKIERGELLVIVGDRTPPAENGRVSKVDFLGKPAPFAQGPFILASVLDCPVFLFFCLREQVGSTARHQIYFEPFAQRVHLPRPKRAAHLQAYCQQFAQALQSYCLMAPEQWFNFYDFWRHDGAADSSI